MREGLKRRRAGWGATGIEAGSKGGWETIRISHTPQPPPKHIIIVLRGVTFRDSTLGTLMIGEILTPG